MFFELVSYFSVICKSLDQQITVNIVLKGKTMSNNKEFQQFIEENFGDLEMSAEQLADIKKQWELTGNDNEVVEEKVEIADKTEINPDELFDDFSDLIRNCGGGGGGCCGGSCR